MLKFCTFCGRKLDTEGFCTNSKCPDYKRKELIETEKKVLHPYIHTDSVSGYVNSADGSVQINYSLKTGGLVLSDE